MELIFSEKYDNFMRESVIRLIKQVKIKYKMSIKKYLEIAQVFF